MTGDLFTYELAHFLPFSREAYLRLFELHNAAVWPFGHLFAAAVIGWGLWAVHYGRTRLLAALLGSTWAFVGWSFFGTHYASLLWAAPHIGVLFGLQGLVLLVGGWRGLLRFDDEAKPRRAVLGRVLLAIAVAGMPLTELVLGRSLLAVGWFGVAPDPTAVGTLGMLLMARTARWPLWIIPCAWGVVSALTSVALHGAG